MTTLRCRYGISLAALGVALAAPSAALADSRVYTTANVTNEAGPVSATVNGTVFINQGIQGAGRLDANTKDFRGETLGSFSGMAMDLTTWRRNADGSYSGMIFTLPDRGPFDGGIDYRNRVHTSNITFKPLTAGSAALPQSAGSQSQVIITPTGGFTLKDTTGLEMTGRDPGASTVTRDGIVYPLANDGTAAGHVSLDAEAIAFRPDGSFYISDEYAAGLYYFDATGKQIGAIQTVPALLPRTGGNINFNSTNPGQTGRRNNQGLEAMAITPDDKKLVTILQSATVQDTNGSNQQTRNNTRILIYDISSNATPTNPIGHYVLQLPVFNNNGSGAAADRTAAQSEMLALNDSQFLVLSRDGLGRGVAANASTSSTPVFKSILLVDTTGATNLVGTQYETGNTPVATNGTLANGIVPVQQVELINLLNPTQLGRVGMNLTRLPLTNPTTLGEKWEAMALAPVLEEGAPQDFFLFVGNDNDFQGTDICFNGTCSVSGALDGTGNNDSILLVYRLTLPTYVDPQALSALNHTTPNVLYGTRLALTGLGREATQAPMRMLNAQRGSAGMQNVSMWLDGDWSNIDPKTSLTALDVDGVGISGGIDFGAATGVRIGAFGGYHKLDGTLDAGAPFEVESWHLGAYASVSMAGGFYVEGAAAWLGNIDLNDISRASAYGQMATGTTTAQGWSGSIEAGWTLPVGGVELTPFGVIDYVDLDLDGYTETGASVSNFTFPDRSFSKLSASVGGEVSAQLGQVRPTLRGGYTFADENGETGATVAIASVNHPMGTVAFPLASTALDSVFGEARIAFTSGQLSAYVSGIGRWGDGGDDLQGSLGIAYAF